METPLTRLTSPHLNGWVAVWRWDLPRADIYPSSSEFLEDSTVQHIRAEINDSTTYPAPFVRFFLIAISGFREMILGRIVQPV